MSDNLSDSRSTDELAARLLHHREPNLLPGDPLSPPLILSAPFHLPGDTNAPFTYGRMSTPTWESLEAAHEVLEGAPCVCFPSGMAAITAVLMATLKAGDRVLLPSDGYYVTRRVIERFLQPLGIEMTLHPTRDFSNAPYDDVALVFAESPSNPGLDVCDLPRVAERSYAAGAKLVVDNTTMTPLLQRPLELGADLVVAADTKAPGGHADLLAGHVASHDTALLIAIREWRTMSGAIASPFDAWLLQRGLETLELRLERMCASAAVVAERLSAFAGSQEVVHGVRFPGLVDDPSYAISSRQMRGSGFLIGLTLADELAARSFLSGCSLVTQSTSFGSVHTAGERRARWGDDVPEGFVRLSIGIEPIEPLWDAIEKSLTSLR